ncbi:MAG: ROK family protein [Actinobacteria bacterium]|nr:ROK family protein [Actinomycetota bacterium]
MNPDVTPVLEVGGTHVTAATVDVRNWSVLGQRHRVPLDSAASAEGILAGFGEAARPIGITGPTRWGVAMPDPFDYARGVALFEGVGKFESLYGLDFGAALSGLLPGTLAGLDFVNDADAFALGEWTCGAARGAHRCLGVTLGTGVGSGWIVDGVEIADSAEVPPGGRIHRAGLDGRPLEEVMSRRAIRAAYLAVTGDEAADVRDIAARARIGDGPAASVLDTALRGLGAVLAPYLDRFRPDVMVVGGSMAASWDLFESSFRAGCADVPVPPIRVSTDAERAGLIGAAWVSRRRSGSADAPPGSTTA